jgi:hypothetical protein
MLSRLKIMQSFDGQILNLPIICDIRIVININNLSEKGSIPGGGRLRPLAAKATTGSQSRCAAGIPIRVAKNLRSPRAFSSTVGLRKRVRVRPHSDRRADPRTARLAGLSLQRGNHVMRLETGQRSARSCYRISPRGRCDISKKSFDPQGA